MCALKRQYMRFSHLIHVESGGRMNPGTESRMGFRPEPPEAISLVWPPAVPLSRCGSGAVRPPDRSR